MLFLINRWQLCAKKPRNDIKKKERKNETSKNGYDERFF